MRKYCRFSKLCPLWDMSSNGREWCGGDTPIPYRPQWERCPIPKKRDRSIKIEKEQLKSRDNI